MNEALKTLQDGLLAKAQSTELKPYERIALIEQREKWNFVDPSDEKYVSNEDYCNHIDEGSELARNYMLGLMIAAGVSRFRR